jgi:hypothetical protein
MAFQVPMQWPSDFQKLPNQHFWWTFRSGKKASRHLPGVHQIEDPTDSKLCAIGFNIRCSG